jgi:hypothetical protein
MRISSLARYAFGIAAGAALLAGCSANGTSPALNGTALPQAGGTHMRDMAKLQKLIAMTNPKHQIPEQHIYNGKSWMKHVPAGTKMVYVADIEYATVDVIDYTTGALLGQATGFSGPYGLCSDKHGDVFVADFYGGSGYEIQAGTTNVITSYPQSGGSPIGCSVDKHGDLAITDFVGIGTYGYGGVNVYHHAAGSPTTIGANAYTWGAGYDKKGNLLAECNYAGVCTSPGWIYLKKGSSTWTTLSSSQPIYFPGPTALNHKTFGASDQDGGGPSSFVIAIYEMKVSGGTATNTATVNLQGNCSGTYIGWSGSYGVDSNKPNGLQYKKITGYTGTNDDCFPSPVDHWSLAGGAPDFTISSGWLPYDYSYGSTEVSN